VALQPGQLGGMMGAVPSQLRDLQVPR